MTKDIPVYSIESGVQIPQGLPPLRLMGVDDSIVFPLGKRSSVQTFASKLKREEGKEFVVKKLDDNNARIWRTK